MSIKVTKTVKCDMCGAAIDVADEQTLRFSILSSGHFSYNVPVMEHNPEYDEGRQDGIVQEPLDLCPECAERATVIAMEVVRSDDGRNCKHVYSWRGEEE